MKTKQALQRYHKLDVQWYRVHHCFTTINCQKWYCTNDKMCNPAQ